MTVTKSRLIYTAGTFGITDELAVCRRLILTVSVLRRPPTQEYQNERSNPPKGFLGYVGLFINSYCERIIPLEFSPQGFLLWDNPAIQLYYTVLCTGANLVDTIVALGLAMTPPAVLLPTTPSPAPFPGCPYTLLKFKLLFGTRIQVDAIGEEVVACAGIVPEATIPDINEPPAPYPNDRARSEDPARSEPEPDELPGDTAPATAEDPDLSLAGVQCFRILNKGLFSGDIVFENFICAVTVFTEPGGDVGGLPTVNIVALGEGGTEVLRSNQASYASNPVTIEAGADDSIRQPSNSFGNCDSCS